MTDDQPKVPRDFTFVLPDDWARIRIAERDRKADIDRVVELVTAQRSDRDSLAPQIRRQLEDVTERLDAGAVEIYLSLTAPQGYPIACSMTVTLSPEAPPGVSAEDVLGGFLMLGGPDAQRSASSHLGHPCARVARQVPATVEGTRFDTLVVQHAFVIPGTTEFVLLDFSTPLLPLAEPMSALFDAVARSFTWVW
ncbi:hypothetical protein H4N58_16215 [Mumia sp. ZJ1417]|uniref:hypothetical protein n=1 Tax=Mumia sp. ZJ1417 TaxID=2708082 RepID=UPI001420CE81|nr:hypothetical protein [Mumia sp. ZJ1417]QMW65700.1 hypothetical protein H4N58_16215 [Mumia sp. ZJ1417]